MPENGSDMLRNMHIAFYTRSGHGEALKDLDYCEKNPLGGSETAMLRIAKVFKERGFDVSIHINLDDLSQMTPDVFVSLRDWRPFYNEETQEGRGIGNLNYLWCQDDVDQQMVRGLADKEIASKVYTSIDGVIQLSHYQLQRWLHELNLPIEKVFLSSNGVQLSAFASAPATIRDRKPQAYYASVPWRGLKELLEIWPLVKGAVPEATLKVCSSMKVYKAEEQENLEKLYDLARSLPGIDYRGSVSQAKLREIALTSRALAYPCVFPETSCIAAMEAMASGAAVVGTSLGALPETAWRNPLIPIQDGWGDAWGFELARVLVDDTYYQTIAEQNLTVSRYNDWKSVADRWAQRFRSDLLSKPSSELIKAA